MNSTKNPKIIDPDSFHNEEIAYWIGVFQSDGYFKKQYVKSKQRIRYYISFTLSDKSLPMIHKFQEISVKYFNRKGCFFSYNSKEDFFQHQYRFGCNEFISLFEVLDLLHKNPPIPPNWVITRKSFFGAYLAGIIDGDGDVRISRSQYPQCKIRISGSKKPDVLIIELKKFLKCGVNSHYRKKINKIKDRVFFSGGQITEFYVSKKNVFFLIEYVLPYINLKYKKEKIIEYINAKGGARDLNSDRKISAIKTHSLSC